MKIDRLETHDRYLDFTRKEMSISECCQDLVDQKPFGNQPFYIFVHSRTDDDGVTKRLIWQPRLTKPKAQTNSMLFKGYPGSDLIKIIWMIPQPELWEQYEKGKVTACKEILESINRFKTDRLSLEMKEDDDLDDVKIDAIYRSISKASKGKLMFKPMI